jgi:hypothetical protein
METEISSQCSQNSVTWIRSAHYCSDIHFNIILPFAPRLQSGPEKLSRNPEVLNMVVACSSETLAHPASNPTDNGDSFPEGKAEGAWSWPLTSISCRGQEKVELYLLSPIRLHGVVLSWASATSLSYQITFLGKLRKTRKHISLDSHVRAEIWTRNPLYKKKEY